jgi:hypothetical protein
MEEKGEVQRASDGIKKSSTKYKEDNPQAPDKSESNLNKKRKKKLSKKRKKTSKTTAPLKNSKKKKEKQPIEKKREIKEKIKLSESDSSSSSSLKSEHGDEAINESASDHEERKEEQLERDKLTYILLSKVVDQVKDFSEDKYIDYEDIANQMGEEIDPEL